MLNFNFYSPTEFVFGKGTENQCGKYVKKYGGSRVLIHYGGGSAVKSGLIDRVKASLDAEGITYVELGGVQPNPRDTLVRKGIELCRKENVTPPRPLLWVFPIAATSGISTAPARR